MIFNKHYWRHSILQTKGSRGWWCGEGGQTGALCLCLSPEKQMLPLSVSFSHSLSLPLAVPLVICLAPSQAHIPARPCSPRDRPCTLLSVYAPLTVTTVVLDYDSESKTSYPTVTVENIISTPFHRVKPLAPVFCLMEINLGTTD